MYVSETKNEVSTEVSAPVSASAMNEETVKEAVNDMNLATQAIASGLILCFKFTFKFNINLLFEADAQHKNALSTTSDNQMDTSEDRGLKSSFLDSIEFIGIYFNLILESPNNFSFSSFLYQVHFLQM